MRCGRSESNKVAEKRGRRREEGGGGGKEEEDVQQRYDSCSVQYLLCALVEEGKGRAFCMDKTALLHKHAEQLRVKEMMEERPLGCWAVLEEQLLIEEELGIVRPLGGGGKEGTKAHAREMK